MPRSIGQGPKGVHRRRSLPAHRRASLRLAALLLIPAMASCFYSRRAADIDRHPIVDTGTGASIIMPGETAPPLAGAARVAEGGVPTASPKIQMIGGSEIDEERHESGKEDPLIFKALSAPLAVLAAPFVAAAEAMKGDPEPGPQVPAHPPERPDTGRQPPRADYESPQAEPRGSRPAGVAARRQTPVPRSYESQQIEAMERELARRQAGGPTPAARRPVAPAVAGPSIADELASLQRAPRERTGTPHAVPAPLETSTAEAPRPVRGAEQAVADGIVDRNEDGRIDLWLYRRDGEIVRKVIDRDFDGRPDTTLYYDPASHRLARVEEDGNRDGATDSWTDYREGEVVRRRVDSDHDGTVDTWTFYRDGEIRRHEQDTSGDGFRDRVGHYEGGRLVREEQDRNGDGRPDLTEYFDAGRKLSRREEDRDHDGRIDVISHYENGRLARRELLDNAATATP